jgi:hypothetical protein
MNPVELIGPIASVTAICELLSESSYISIEFFQFVLFRFAELVREALEITILFFE